jgi:uncharacterized delta-60 repeat protein
MKFALRTLLSALWLISFFSSSSQQLASHYHIKAAGTSYHQIADDGLGNTYVYGAFDDLGGKNLGRLLKLDLSGNPVKGFENLYADGVIGDVVILPDKKILISGSFTKINGEAVGSIVRLNTDGSIDETFSCPLSEAGDMELQTTGKIIVLNEGVFERLNPDGSIDQSFNFQNYVYSTAEFEIGPDNSIYFSSYSIVHKLTADGVDDNSFQIGTGADRSHISALEVQSDGKVIVGGFFLKYNGVESKSIIRLNTNGTVDDSFTAGNNIEGQLFQIIQRSDTKILIGGQFYQYAGQSASLVELNTDGTFSRNIAVVTINNITSIFEGPDTKITIAGEFDVVNGTPVFGMCRFNTNYTIDKTFSPKITLNNSNGLRVVVDNDMRATLAGDHQLYGIFNDLHFVQGKMLRTTALGGYDPSFKPDQTASTIYGTHVQADGKIIISGGFGNSVWEILRLNQNGTKDVSFNIGTGPTTNGTSTLVYAIRNIGDLIFFGGSFTHFSGMPSTSLVAVNSNGSVVKTFSVLPANSQVNDIVTQSDGKIILTGYFDFPSGKLHIIRLNNDGSRDETFHDLTLLQPPSDIGIDQNDNIYLSGESLRPDGSLLESLIKLTPDGFVDGSFSIGSGFEPWAFLTTMTVLADGRIAVGGHFDTVQGVEQPGFAILSQNGSLIPQEETFFGKGSAATDMFYKNGQLFLAGKFKKPDYTESYALVKVLLEDVALPAAPSNLSVSLPSPGVLSVTWTDNSPDRLVFVVERAIDNLDTFEIVDTVAANVNQYADQISRNHFHAYRVRAINDAGYSSYSNIDSLRWAPAPEGIVTLSAPTPTSSQITLSWQGTIRYHDGFIVEYTTGNNSNYTILDTLPVGSNSFAHSIVRNSPYRYRVKAYNQFGFSASQVVLVEWLPVPDGSLNLTITNPEAGKIVLSWASDIEYHDGFIIERSSRLNTGYAPLDTVGITVNTFTDLTDENDAYYRVVAYNVNGRITSKQMSMVVTGIEKTSELEISVYPNPAKEYVTVFLDDQASSACLTIVDRNGRVLSEVNHLSTGEHRLDIRSFTPGVYLMMLRSNGKHLTRRLVKQ